MGDDVFLKMSYHPCVSGCGRYLIPQDGHDCCLTCLSIQHAEEAFVDGSCSSCADMTILELRNRLRYVKHGRVPLPLPRSAIRTGTQAAAPQPARRRGHPPAAAPAPTLQQQPSTRQRCGAGRRQDSKFVQASAKPGSQRKCKRP